MSDYISREAVKQIIVAQCGECADACLEFDGIQPDCNQCLLCGAKKAIDSIPAADVRPRWIPVGERLPETGVDVLVKFPQNMAVASIDIGEWVVNSGDGWCTDINLAGGEKNPTHWMPLPQGPEDE